MVLIFLRNDSDCKDVDLYNTRKRYAVIENLDFMRNIFWQASCFSKIKNPISTVQENKVWLPVLHFDLIAASMRAVFHWTTILLKECLWEQRVNFLSVCIEGILQVFTIFYLQRKFSIFLRNDCGFKAVEGLNNFEKLSWL